MSRNALANATLDTIASTASNSTIAYSQILPGIVPSDLSKITNQSSVMTTVFNLVSASNSQYVNMSSAQVYFIFCIFKLIRFIILFFFFLFKLINRDQHF